MQLLFPPPDFTGQEVDMGIFLETESKVGGDTVHSVAPGKKDLRLQCSHL